PPAAGIRAAVIFDAGDERSHTRHARIAQAPSPTRSHARSARDLLDRCSVSYPRDLRAPDALVANDPAFGLHSALHACETTFGMVSALDAQSLRHPIGRDAIPRGHLRRGPS
ncbi:MAG TPA: hypothetical protein VMF89_29870, partial [Polyangiales bacterium]|nr:hypothetical protein [Polyangiales bacterium]